MQWLRNVIKLYASINSLEMGQCQGEIVITDAVRADDSVLREEKCII